MLQTLKRIEVLQETLQKFLQGTLSTSMVFISLVFFIMTKIIFERITFYAYQSGVSFLHFCAISVF